ncbi:MAG: hypothetical protein CMO74_15360 [Verrucomicrobiales bacterium]|nr:hypothetical protein [Verrucomicrobiales bacterium]
MTKDQVSMTKEAPMPKPQPRVWLLVIVWSLVIGHWSFAAPRPVAELLKSAKPSVVTVIHEGRGAAREGTGTGFVVGKNLIATCLHVVGEARPVHVRLGDGTKLEVLAVHAWDRKLDLAVLKVKGGEAMKALALGDSSKLIQGAPVVAIGNPMGLEGSVVQGVLSARREMELGEMLQLAIPVEPGNSGGPVLDREGRVHGIMTLKSRVTANLGFAMPVNALKPLLAKPNPVPIARWLTIGALNPREWEPMMGARWTQRAGRIRVREAGSGFGGRSLCLSKLPKPKLPYELEVTVKLDDERGAAGLAFAADGGQRHYGFYPTAGKLRLTRFDGETVFTWKILQDMDVPAYRPGDWNTIKVRHEKGLIKCFVNDQLAFDMKDDGLANGRIGLAKFRDTEAEFRDFRVGKKLTSLAPAPALLAKLEQAVAALKPVDEFDAKTVNELKPNANLNNELLRKRADLLEAQAGQLRRLANLVHERAVQDALRAEFKKDDAKVNLLRAALLVGKLDNADIDLAHYEKEVGEMATEIRAKLPKDADAAKRLAALSKYMFEENGYHGSRGDYYNRANSYLNEVIDDREGIPITLSVLYMELARRLDLKMAGIGLPGHFVVAQLTEGKEPQLIDVFENGKLISHKDAGTIVRNFAGVPLRDEHLAPVDNRAIIVRMLRNLIGISNENQPPEVVLRYLNTLLLLQPDSPQEHLNRALMYMRLKQNAKAKEDVRWLLENDPPGFNRDRLMDLFRRL